MIKNWDQHLNFNYRRRDPEEIVDVRAAEWRAFLLELTPEDLLNRVRKVNAAYLPSLVSDIVDAICEKDTLGLEDAEFEKGWDEAEHEFEIS